MSISETKSYDCCHTIESVHEGRLAQRVGTFSCGVTEVVPGLSTTDKVILVCLIRLEGCVNARIYIDVAVLTIPVG